MRLKKRSFCGLTRSGLKETRNKVRRTLNPLTYHIVVVLEANKVVEEVVADGVTKSTMEEVVEEMMLTNNKKEIVSHQIVRTRSKFNVIIVMNMGISPQSVESQDTKGTMMKI